MSDPDTFSVLQNVTNAAVWGSLAGSFFLGSFLLVQGFVDRLNRSRFILFAAVNFAVVANDLAHPYLSLYDYEKLRIVIWSLYSGALLWLLRFPRAFAISAPLFFSAAATAVWVLIKPELGTSAVVGPVAFLAAVAHALHYRKRRCYASCVLCGSSLALGLLSTFYYLFIASGDQALIVTGYAHYAALTLMALLFGWVYLPRELRGNAPVHIDPRTALLYLICMAIGQTIVLVSLVGHSPWSMNGYLSGALLLLGATLLLFFYHRHQLVIHTDNVTVLLNERTASLRTAQLLLREQNDRQAHLLDQQAKELGQKNQVIERQRRLELAAQTAGQAAHDIRNLLSPMSLHLQVLDRQCSDSSSHEQVVVIKRHVQQMAELTDQLLAMSRRGQLEFRPVLLNEVLREAALDSADVSMQLEWRGEAWANGAAHQLSRAVANLVTNALDATGRVPGQVTISCGTLDIVMERRCHMGFLLPARYSFVRVADQGPGISDEIIERIFEPFFSSKRVSSSSGSGLGLSIVAAVVDDHQGVLDLETSSAGTAFTIYLPYLQAPTVTLDTIPAHRGARVLLVDDDPAVRKTCAELLQRSGYSVVTADSLRAAREQLRGEVPQLLLLDYHLPDGVASELLEECVSNDGASSVLIYSSYLTNDECRRLGLLGVTRFAYKPLTARALLSAVAETLSGNRALSQELYSRQVAPLSIR